MMAESHQQYSTVVSKALDVLGYSYDNIKARQAHWEELYKRENELDHDSEITIIVAGSKAEGVTGLCENDTDIMTSLGSVVCCEDIQEVDQDRYKAVFVMDRNNVAPGYRQLRHADINKVRRLYREDTFRLVDATFQNENGDFLLSSKLLVNNECDKTNRGHGSGPALTMISTVLRVIDAVPALPCKSKSILQSWVSRPRHQKWPPREVIEEISTMDGHMVPVGFTGSDKQNEEWRICYTPAEIRLVKSFNETQLKLYVLLKTVAKKLLTQVCPDITSYIIKNLVFWMSELCPLDRFTQENLTDLLILSLKFLWNHVDTKCLRSYVIPARNLFGGKLEQQQKQVLYLISSLVREGPTFILRRPELHVLRSKMVQVNKYQELALCEQYNREQTEKLCFQTMLENVGVKRFRNELQNIQKTSPVMVPEVGKRYHICGVVLERADLSRLRAGNWLCDKVLNAFLRCLMMERNVNGSGHIYVLPAYLASLWDAGRYDTWLCESVQLPMYDWVFMPVNLNNNHWVLIAADVRQKTISVLDSMSVKPNKVLMGKWRRYMKMRMHATGDRTKWADGPHTSAQQSDGSSCGPFVLLNAMALMNGIRIEMLTQDDAVNMREYVMHRLLLNAKEPPAQRTVCDQVGCMKPGIKKTWISCVNCGRWIHFECAGIQQTPKEDFICTMCHAQYF